MKNKTKTILCTLAVAGVIGTSGILAYLTDNDQATNNFTVGKVDITLEEPNWNEDNAENITANQTIEKDPQVKNDGKNNAYVYLKVTVPVAEVITADDDGTLLNDGNPTATQLFTFTPNAKWKEITTARVEGATSNTYVYYYEEEVVPGATTEKLFTEVKFANVIEGQVDDTVGQKIDVDAYAIQSDNLANNETQEAAYQIYLNQNN